MQESPGIEGTECPFCLKSSNAEIIIESQLIYAIYDKYPVNPGHVLIIPKRHVQDYFDLTDEEQLSCWSLVNELKKMLDRKFRPDAYNIGINNLFAAGQTIPHVHIHLIPRYQGDVKKPRGGVRGVIPDKMDY